VGGGGKPLRGQVGVRTEIARAFQCRAGGRIAQTVAVGFGEPRQFVGDIRVGADDGRGPMPHPLPIPNGKHVGQRPMCLEQLGGRRQLQHGAAKQRMQNP
jgi:hypothetical protein